MNKELVDKLATQAGWQPVPGADFHNSLQDVYNQKMVMAVLRECLTIYEILDNGNRHMQTKNYRLAVLRHFGIQKPKS